MYHGTLFSSLSSVFGYSRSEPPKQEGFNPKPVILFIWIKSYCQAFFLSESKIFAKKENPAA